MSKEKEKLKETVYGAAHSVFLKKGIAATTLEDVAKEAKTDLKSVKGTYPTMDSLLAELINRDIEESSQLFTKVINDRGKADIKLTRLVRELLTRYHKSYPLFLIVSVGVESVGNDEEFLRNKLGKDQVDRYRQNTAIIGRLIAQGQSENLFTDVDPYEAAYLLRGMIGAAIRYHRITKKDDDLRDHADIIMRIFLKGLLR